jgi:hypothetical protein
MARDLNEHYFEAYERMLAMCAAVVYTDTPEALLKSDMRLLDAIWTALTVPQQRAWDYADFAAAFAANAAQVRRAKDQLTATVQAHEFTVRNQARTFAVRANFDCHPGFTWFKRASRAALNRITASFYATVCAAFLCAVLSLGPRLTTLILFIAAFVGFVRRRRSPMDEVARRVEQLVERPRDLPERPAF